MRKLTVFYCGWGERWPLATLADNGKSLLFEYTEEAMRQQLELSPRMLKLRVAAYGDFPEHQMRLPGLVADSLPDGWGLLLMDRAFRRVGLKSVSPLDRLAFIGDRAMGALSYEPADPGALPDEDVKLLDVARSVQSVLEGNDAEVLRRLMLLGGSPQGARPKALVHYDPSSGVMRTQASGVGEPWLMKFPANGEHKDVCALEHAYAQLAGECGLDMPETRYFDLDGKHAAFGIKRFDRQDGMRVPMHTLAGFLHADHRIPSVDCTTFLRATRAITHDEREVAKAYRRVVFNVAFNNRDDHVKNFAFCLDRRRHWKLAPAYDLTFNEGPGGEHQMDVCGEGRVPGKADLLRLAAEAALPLAEATVIIDKVAGVASNLKASLADCPIRKVRQREVVAAVDANLARLRSNDTL
ncbi:MAG: type II toxin-antitoxin system HipA family toxin [Gallionella sp.]|nr:type II toxin-antitoxin system HipA family toxin [Gallionella sp.]